MSKVPQEAIEVAIVQAGKHLAVKLSEVYRAADQKPADCQAIRDWMIAIKAADAARVQVVEVEPVAFLIEHSTNPNEGKDLSFLDITDADKKYGFTSQPLYKRPLAPQPTEREKVLEEALRASREYVEAYDTREHNNEQDAVLRRIDAALAGKA